MSSEYPTWICMDCGEKHGRNPNPDHCFTCHEGVCGVCGQTKIVTEPRDFGHLKETWKQ